MARDLFLCLGDSITCGAGAPQPELSYGALAAAHLREQSICREALYVCGPTWTAQHLLRAVRNTDAAVWDRTLVVSILIGGNDLLRRYYAMLATPAPMREVKKAIDGCTHALNAILETIKEYGVPYVFVFTLYNPLPNSQCAVTSIRHLNGHIVDVANRFNGSVVQLETLWQGQEANWIQHYRTGQLQDLSSMYDRPLHPNPDGHRAIADALIRRIHTTIAGNPLRNVL